MSSKNNTTPAQLDSYTLFVALLVLSLFLWFLYRSLFNFPVSFDETVGKALFFGLPIWIFISMVKANYISDLLAPKHLRRGLMEGLAIGGLFGFTGILVAYLTRPEVQIVPAPLFMIDNFWWEFFMAMLTSFWESLFFYGFIQSVIERELKDISLLWQSLLVAAIFLIFHVPNIILRFNGIDALSQVFLLGLFGLGQALLFTSRRNIYTLMVTQTIWGMVLLVHF